MSIEKSIQKLREQIQQLKEEIEWVAEAPVTREEWKERVASWVDGMTARAERTSSALLSLRSANPRTVRDADLLAIQTSVAQVGHALLGQSKQATGRGGRGAPEGAWREPAVRDICRPPAGCCTAPERTVSALPVAAWLGHRQRGEQQRLPCPKRKTMDAGNSSRIQPVFCHGPKGVVLYPATGPYRHSPDAGNSSRVVGLLRGFPKGVK